MPAAVLDPRTRRDLSDARARAGAAERQVALIEAQVRVLRDSNEKLRLRAAAAERAAAENAHRVDTLTAELAELKARVLGLPRNSSNSSAPPSADPPGKATGRKYPSRATSGRKPGGQPGHRGAASARREPTSVVRYEPEGMCGCGAPTADGAETGTKTRQIVGVAVQVAAVDHVAVTRVCGCGRTHAGTWPDGLFPDGSTNPVVFDASVKVLAVGLAECAQVPVRPACAWLEGMLGVAVAPATVRAWIVGLAASLDGWDDRMVGLLRAAPLVGADETPIKVEGFPNAHAHVAVTDRLTRFHLGGRGKADIVAGGVLENHRGTLVCDGLASYRGIGAASVQACAAHLLRELRYTSEAFAPHDPDTPHPYPQLAGIGAPPPPPQPPPSPWSAPPPARTPPGPACPPARSCAWRPACPPRPCSAT